MIIVFVGYYLVSTALATLPLGQGAKKVFRRSSKSASVPFEGRTLQYDVRTTPQGGRGWMKVLTVQPLCACTY